MKIVDYNVIGYFESQGYIVKHSKERIAFFILEKDGKQTTLDKFEYPDINRSLWREQYQRLMKGGFFAYTQLNSLCTYLYTKKDIESKHQAYYIFWKKELKNE